LIAAQKSVEEIRKFIGLDSLGYLSTDNLVSSTCIPREDLCLACFDGNYPIPIDSETGKYSLE
jgi:amidophosphoribosyltransferase